MADKNVLLVEGKDDEHVFYSLLVHHQVPKRFKIKDKEGFHNIFNDLDVELDASGLEKLGIVIDADTDIASRWLSLKDRLNNLGYVVSENPQTEGAIFEQVSRPRVGVWLMPDNTLPGMLEHFVSFLGATDDPLWQVAGNCLNEIPEAERRFIPNHFIKAHLHTWLAWQENPGSPLGLAITKRYLDAEAHHAKQLITWVRRLFEI
jgi:hypothetical protein